MRDFANCGNVKIELSHCVRNTFSKSLCKDCYNVCIPEAIEFSPKPKINSNACIQCGLCYAACKFSAINIKKDNLYLIKSTEDDNKIDVGCIFAESKIKIACVSRLSEDVLLDWFLKEKNIIIKKGNCKTCKFKNTLAYFYDSLKNAVILSKAINKKPKIKIQTKKSKSIFIPKETLSRRDILSNLRPKTSSTKRKIITRLLRDNIKTDVEYRYSARMSISNECNLCKICQHVCPANAIQIIKGKKSGYIYFDPSACVKCYACEDACIRKAIKIEDSTVLEITKEPYEIFEVKQKVCKSCGAVFYSNNENNICFSCLTKQERKKSLIDFFKDI